jgi:hypothetical protein
MHQQSPAGVQFIGALHFEHRVSIQRFSPNLAHRAAQLHLAASGASPDARLS